MAVIPVERKRVKVHAYVRNDNTLFRIEAVREIGKRREVLVENAVTGEERWVLEATVLGYKFVCQGE